MEDARIKEFQEMVSNQISEKYKIEEEAIINYMIKNNLSVDDIKKYGERIYFCGSGKTIYKYKNEIIIEIDLEQPDFDYYFKSFS